MFSSKKLLAWTIFAASALAACSSTPQRITDSSSWSNRMQGFAQNLYTLFPLASDPAAFRNPDNHRDIDTSLTVLALMAHDMSKELSKEKLKAAKVDPAVGVLAGTFKKELNTAVDAFRKGDYEYARISTRGALQLCIQCHARKPNDQNRSAILDPQRLAEMKPLYRADLLAAARNFDEALATYQEVLSDPTLARTDSTAWGEAGKRALAIAVRAKGNPGESEKIVDTILSSSQAPHYFLSRARVWKDQIRDWKLDTLRIKLGNNDYEKAKTLMQLTQKGKVFNSYIYLLRASSYLHSYLQQVDDPTLAAKAYLLLGECYEALKDPGEVGLAKNYYKSCILSVPHSQTSMQCFDRYEEATYVDAFNGASSISLSTVDYLDYLRNTASP